MTKYNIGDKIWYVVDIYLLRYPDAGNIWEVDIETIKKKQL